MIDGSELVVSIEGRQIPRADLTGAVLALKLQDGGLTDVRIDHVFTDPKRLESDVVLYDLSIADSGGTWTPVCEAEPDGAPHAVLQPTSGGAIAIFCTAGALGKCIRLGYRPWAVRDGVPLDAYWRACVKMIRADYCGDGQPTTLDGMLIDIHDPLGIQIREGAPGLSFEAAWDEQGAVCVAHPRVPQKAPLQSIGATCPRLLDHLGPACTESAANRQGVPLLYNASRGDGIPEQVH